MLKFKQFINENSNIVYFTFGRMNPPTIGHGKLLDKLKENAGKNPYKIFLSHTQDNKKNPLIYEEKLKISRKFFPKHSRNIIESNVKNILEVANFLYKENYSKIVLVVGEDRKYEFDILLNKYNGVKGNHGFYLFETINIISAGLRDPDSISVEGMSSTKLRESVRNSDFITFAQGIPKNVTTSEAKKVYNSIRLGLGLNEEKTFKNKNLILSTSDIREKYIKGELFKIDDLVQIKESNKLVKIKILGSNYVIVEDNDGKRHRKWLTDIIKK